MRTFLKDCRWGRFLLLEGDMVSQYAELYGEWCEAEVSLFRRVLKPESNVIEIGAHIGLHAVALSRIAPQGRILCFEPQRILHQVLCANCALNNCLNVHAYGVALGDHRGTVAIAATDYATPWNYGAFSVAQGFDAEGAFPGRQWREEVALERLADIPLAGALESLALVKIDAEGMEIAVLEGAAALIERHQPVLFIENNRQENGDALIEAVRGRGYECYWYCVERFRPDNFNRATRKVPGADLNMACFPRGTAAPAGLQRVVEFADLKQGIVPFMRP